MKKNITVLASLIMLGVACAPNMKRLAESNKYKSQAENSISAAKEKIRIAKEKGAEKYSGDNFNFAMFSLEEAEKCYNNGVLNHRKSYKIARENYVKAVEYGNSSIEFSDLAIEISEISKVLEGAGKAIEEAKAVDAWVYAAKKMNEASTFLEQAWQSFRAGKYPEARESAKQATKSANEARKEAEIKRRNLEERTKRFEKAKEELTAGLSNKNDIDGIIEAVKELLAAEVDLLRYRIDISEDGEEKTGLKQSLEEIKEAESGISGLIKEYYKAKKEFDDVKQRVGLAKEERDMLEKELVRLKAKAKTVVDELDDLIRKRDGL